MRPSPPTTWSGTFMPVMDDPTAADRRERVTRVVLCSGKVAIDLDSSSARAEATGVAVVRVEQLAPFQSTAIRTVLAQYPNLQDLVWLQEEPRNMGAASWMEPRLRELVDGAAPVRYLGRIERSSPAEGSLDLHTEVQARIVVEAFADVPDLPAKTPRANGTVKNGKTSSNGKANGVHPEPAKVETAKADLARAEAATSGASSSKRKK